MSTRPVLGNGNGLVIITGTSGSGQTTLMASMLKNMKNIIEPRRHATTQERWNARRAARKLRQEMAIWSELPLITRPRL